MTNEQENKRSKANNGKVNNGRATKRSYSNANNKVNVNSTGKRNENRRERKETEARKQNLTTKVNNQGY